MKLFQWGIYAYVLYTILCLGNFFVLLYLISCLYIFSPTVQKFTRYGAQENLPEIKKISDKLVKHVLSIMESNYNVKYLKLTGLPTDLHPVAEYLCYRKNHLNTLHLVCMYYIYSYILSRCFVLTFCFLVRNTEYAHIISTISYNLQNNNFLSTLLLENCDTESMIETINNTSKKIVKLI